MSNDFAEPPEAPPSKAKKKGQLLELGPRLAPKWARVYVDLWQKRGRKAAIAWAKVFLPAKKDRELLKAAAEDLMKKRGIYRETTPPEAS